MNKLDKDDKPIVITENEKLTSYYKYLIKKFSFTKGVRFKAAIRHNFNALASVWTIVFLSTFVLTSTTFINYFSLDITEEFKKYLIWGSLISSAFIIPLSVIESGKKHYLKSALFLKCGEKIIKLTDELTYQMNAQIMEFESAKEILDKYHVHMNDFQETHRDSDYYKYLTMKSKSKSFKIIWSIRYWVDCWSTLILALIIPPTFLFIVILNVDVFTKV